MGTVEGNEITIETPGVAFPFPVEVVILVCDKPYVIYKKEEIFSSGSHKGIRFITYLREASRRVR